MNVTVIFSGLARIILELLYSQAADSQVQKHPLKVSKCLVISLVDTHEWMNEIPTVPIHFLATVHHSGWGKYREFAKGQLLTVTSSSLFAFESLLKDEHTPVIEKRVKKQVQPPWMSNDIKAMKERDKRLKTASRWNLTDDWLCYRHAKNKTTNLIYKHSFARDLKETPLII